MENQFEHLAQFSYSKFASHYSKRNWFCNERLWDQLDDDTKQFWIDFVKHIKTNFKPFDSK